MKGLKNNNHLIIILVCACALVMTKKMTQYLDESLSRAPIIGNNFHSAGSTPKNLGNLYPVFAQALESNKNHGAVNNIDQYFVPPPQEAPAPEPPKMVAQKIPEPVAPVQQPKPEPKPDHLRAMLHQFSLDGLSNHGAYINGRFYKKGDVVYQNRVGGQKFIVKVAGINPDKIFLADNQHNRHAIKFKLDL